MTSLVRSALLVFLLAALSGCGPDLLVRADQPLALAEVHRRKQTDFPFPQAASNIHYAVYRDWQAFEYIVRFDAPPTDCAATVSAALGWHERGEAAVSHPSVPIERVSIPSSSYLHPVSWWDGAVIQQGVFAGEDSSHKPTIWIDSELGRFYYRSTD